MVSEQINEVDKSLVRLTEQKEKWTWIHKIINERRDATTNTTDIQRIMRVLRTIIHQQIGQLRKKVDKFLDTQTDQDGIMKK